MSQLVQGTQRHECHAVLVDGEDGISLDGPPSCRRVLPPPLALWALLGNEPVGRHGTLDPHISLYTPRQLGKPVDRVCLARKAGQLALTQAYSLRPVGEEAPRAVEPAEQLVAYSR